MFWGDKDHGLTPRELEILQLLVDGSTIKDTAARLGIGYYTANVQVRSRGSAIAKAVKEGLV